MANEDKKTAQISASLKDSPGTSIGDNSDRERQESHSNKAEGTFEAGDNHHIFRPIDSYEGLHRWDPYFQWTEQEEKKVVRKVGDIYLKLGTDTLTSEQIDLRVCTFACVTFFALQLDRGNIGQALSSTLLKDLEMTSNDYNLGQTIFLVCFLLAEMPSQLISKRLGPDRWIPIQMISWSLVAACQSFLQGRASYLALRALLGLLEGGL